MPSEGLPQLPVFTPEELRSCRKGECCMCGRCCIVFNMHAGLPSIQGDPHSSLVRKDYGVRCPQLVRLSDGRYACAVHEHKGEVPSLELCRKWNGKWGLYEELVHDVRQNVLRPYDRAHVQQILTWLREGNLVDVDLDFKYPYQLVHVLNVYLACCESMPVELFEKMHMRQVLTAWHRIMPFLFFRVLEEAGITADAEHPLRRQFYHEYIEPILNAPPSDAGGRVRHLVGKVADSIRRIILSLEDSQPILLGTLQEMRNFAARENLEIVEAACRRLADRFDIDIDESEKTGVQ